MQISGHHPILLAALFSSGVALGAGQHYEGTAYSLPEGKIAYREEHWIDEQRGIVERLVLYKCADGRPFARKKVIGPAGSAVPDFELIDGRDGYREGVRSRDGHREVFVQERGAPEKSARLPETPGAVIDAGFDTFVRGHWKQLGEPREVPVPFLIPSRLKYMDLSLAGAGATRENGEDLRLLRMKVDAWYGFVAPTLELTYTADRRLRRFEGISNVRDAAGKNQKVRIEFPLAATPASMEAAAAAALPLAKNCES
jgi:hypothetical protein